MNKRQHVNRCLILYQKHIDMSATPYYSAAHKIGSCHDKNVQNDVGRDCWLDSGQFTFAKSESPQWPEEVIILQKNGLTQPPRNTTLESHPYAGLYSAFDFPQISFPTSGFAAGKHYFFSGNTTEIIQRCSSLLVRNSLGKLINQQQKWVICEMQFSDLLLCNNGVKQLFEPLY